MKLHCIGKNETEITTETGTKILFSYETAVAVINKSGCFVTDEKYSKTTTKHLNKWVGDLEHNFVPQSIINLLSENHELALSEGAQND
jgi:hypothetical protein